MKKSRYFLEQVAFGPLKAKGIPTLIAAPRIRSNSYCQMLHRVAQHAPAIDSFHPVAGLVAFEGQLCGSWMISPSAERVMCLMSAGSLIRSWFPREC